MSARYDFDIIVIGAGIAGFVSAVTANGLGKRVAIIEKRRVGGNCTNFTCIPSKALISASSVAREITRRTHVDLQDLPVTSFDTSHLMARVRSIVEKAYRKDLPETFEQIGIRVLSGTAAFLGNHEVAVDGTTLTADKFIIATGTRPFVPSIDGLERISFLTNENLYDLERLPKSLTILGGGVDGLEYASAFGRLGVATTVVEMSPRLLPMVDRELSNRLVRTLRRDGITILAGVKTHKVWEEHGKVVLMCQLGEGRFAEVQAERVLVSIGRKPDIAEIALEKAGVGYTGKGIITDKNLRTSARNIYACGDVVGPYQLASTAEHQGMVAATNAVLPFKRKVDYRNNVYAIFTEPPLAYIGLTEEEAHRKYGLKLKIYRFDYGNMRRALVDGEEEGVAKLLCDGAGRLVGVHILGKGAPEVVHEAQVVKAFGQPLHKLHGATHAYPTYAQATLGRAGQLAYLDRISESVVVRTGLKLLPGCSNRLSLARERLAENQPIPPFSVTSDTNTAIQAEEAGHGKACILFLPPDLLEHDEQPFVDAWASATPSPHHVILDFSNLRRINGLGAGILIKLYTRSRKKGPVLSAFGLSEGLRNVLRVTGLDRVIRIHENRRQALSSAGIVTDKATQESAAQPVPLSNSSCWAESMRGLKVFHTPPGARRLNVAGHEVKTGVNGFGRLWQKTFRLYVADPDVTAEQAVGALKQNFPAFQSSRNRFYPSANGIAPGEIVLFDSFTPAGPISTGVMILYADDRSFTFIAPQGHPECGTVTFSADRMEGQTIVQITGLARASDPLYEAGFRAMGSTVQNKVWTYVLISLANHLGVPATVRTEEKCIDGRLQWSQFGNVWYNAQIRTLMHEPLRWLTVLTGRDRVDKADQA